MSRLGRQTVLAMTLLGAGAAMAQDPAAAEPAPTDLVIMPPDNASGQDDLDWLQTGIVRVLAHDLIASQMVTVVDPRRLETEMTRAGLARTGLGDPQVINVARRLKASQAVVGAFSAPDDQGNVTLNLRLLSTLTGRTLAGAQIRAPIEAPMGAARTLVSDLLVRARFEGVSVEKLSRFPAPTGAVLSEIHRALLLRLAEPAAARKHFTAAVKEAPVAARQFPELNEAFPEVVPTLLVLPVVPRGSTPTWWGDASQTVLATDLAKLGLKAPRKKLAVAKKKEWTLAEAAEAGRTLGADSVLLATIDQQKGRVTLEANLIASSSSDIEAVAIGSGATLTAALVNAEERLAGVMALDFEGFKPTLMSVGETDASLEQRTTAGPAPKDGAASSVAEARPRITRFDAGAGPGGASVLSWNAADVEACSIEGIGKVPVRGRRMVTPEQTTDYVLECRSGDVVVDASTSVTMQRAIRWQPIAFWVAMGTAGVGAVITVGGFVFASFPAALANQLHGMQLLVSDADEQDTLRAQRDQMALVANLSIAAAAVGAVILVGSLGTLVAAELVE